MTNCYFKWIVKKKSEETVIKHHSFLSMPAAVISKLKWKIKQHAVIVLLTLSAKRSTSEPHTLSLRRSSEDDLKEYFLFPIELLPMTSAGSLFSDSTVCTNAGFKARAMNTHLSLSNDGDLFSLFIAMGKSTVKNGTICHGISFFRHLPWKEMRESNIFYIKCHIKFVQYISL